MTVTVSTEPIALATSGRKFKGEHHVDLQWSGATGPVDVCRNGNPLATTVSGTSYSDATG